MATAQESYELSPSHRRLLDPSESTEDQEDLILTVIFRYSLHFQTITVTFPLLLESDTFSEPHPLVLRWFYDDILLFRAFYFGWHQPGELYNPDLPLPPSHHPCLSTTPRTTLVSTLRPSVAFSSRTCTTTLALLPRMRPTLTTSSTSKT